MYDDLSHTFRFQSQFYITNQSNTIASVQVDFDNGQGLQTVTSGVNQVVSWPSYGKKIITTRITYTNATVKPKHGKSYCST